MYEICVIRAGGYAMERRGEGVSRSVNCRRGAVSLPEIELEGIYYRCEEGRGVTCRRGAVSLPGSQPLLPTACPRSTSQPRPTVGGEWLEYGL